MTVWFHLDWVFGKPLFNPSWLKQIMIPARSGIMPLFAFQKSLLSNLTLIGEGDSVDKQTTDEMQTCGLVISVN